MRMTKFIQFISAIDNDFVVPVNYAVANLDDGEVVSECDIEKEQALYERR
jgi:hypothetical protein